MYKKFSESLKRRYAAGFIPVIPDIKRRSPKEGDLLKGRDPVQTALNLAAAGAPVLSVVTERREFGGSLALLEQIVQATKLPVLRKDFISSREDIIETAHAGAAAVLLISSLLDKNQLRNLYELALEQDLEPLVETHQAAELKFAASLGAQLTGINNRDIRILEKDEGTVSATAGLAQYKPAGSLLISESAIYTEQDVLAAVSAGADAVLVGTALWQAPEIISKYMQLSRARRMLKVCGLMNAQDVDTCLESKVDILGFVTEYPLAVPWNLTRDQAKNLIDRTKTADGAARTCVVTGGSVYEIVNLAKALRPDLIQLHYQESLSDTIKVIEELTPLGIGVIKTIPRSLADRREQFKTTDLIEAVEALNKTGLYAVLADSRSPANAGSGQLSFDSGFCRQVVQHSSKPVFAAGGIRPDQITDVISTASTGLIDMMTGTETGPGHKSRQLISQAVAKTHLF